MSKKILLISSVGPNLTPQESELYRVPARDPLAVKIYKHLNYVEIESILCDELPVDDQTEINWVILFKDAEIETEDVLIFCEENKYNLLVLKEEFENINGHTGFEIIHNYYLKLEEEICKTITSRLE